MRLTPLATMQIPQTKIHAISRAILGLSSVRWKGGISQVKNENTAAGVTWPLTKWVAALFATTNSSKSKSYKRLATPCQWRVKGNIRRTIATSYQNCERCQCTKRGYKGGRVEKSSKILMNRERAVCLSFSGSKEMEHERSEIYKHVHTISRI